MVIVPFRASAIVGFGGVKIDLELLLRPNLRSDRTLIIASVDFAGA